ncbi:MAG: 16S rRNA (guanine(527)-N(7))-methyltransferase RsmG [Planctomycetaceae bacterium]|nr:16S rRNA (guanine(527)-N(7))-methyltransferase RsmG [Planctomycetaceae bacterium]
MTELINDLQAAVAKYELQVAEPAQLQICRYCELLWDWNRKINLTRHEDMETFVARDLFDTLRLSPFIPADSTVLDIGSGGGVPGIPLAITRPGLKVDLAESVGKKARVLDSIARRLGLKMRVHSQRGEKVLANESYNVLTIRAVASLRKLLFWFQKVPNAFDSMLLIKGPRWQQEFAEAAEEGLTENVAIETLASYRSPGHDGQSVILSVSFGTDSSEPPASPTQM